MKKQKFEKGDLVYHIQFDELAIVTDKDYYIAKNRTVANHWEEESLQCATVYLTKNLTLISKAEFTT